MKKLLLVTGSPEKWTAEKEMASELPRIDLPGDSKMYARRRDEPHQVAFKEENSCWKANTPGYIPLYFEVYYHRTLIRMRTVT